MATKPKLTPEVHERLVKLIRRGVPQFVACEGVGIAARTLSIWRKRAREGSEPHKALVRDLDQARAQAQQDLLAMLRKHGKRDAKAIMWMLEHVYSDRYGAVAEMRAKKRIEGGDAHSREPIQVSIGMFAPEDKPAKDDNEA